MRGLSSAGTRPCLQSLQATARAAPRHTAAPRRRVVALSHSDAFLLCMPVALAAAFATDAIAKLKQSQELDRQIEQVQQETEALRERQAQAWDRIQARSIARGAALLQKRLFSTSCRLCQSSSQAVAESAEYEDAAIEGPNDSQAASSLWNVNVTEDTASFSNAFFHEPQEVDLDPPPQVVEDVEDPDVGGSNPSYLTQSIQEEEDHYLKDDLSTMDEQPVQLNMEAIQTQMRYERLHATRMALELLLQIRMQHTGTSFNKVGRKIDLHSSVDFIVAQLNKVKKMSYHSGAHELPYVSVLPPTLDHQKQILGSKVDLLIDAYRQGQLRLDTFVIQFAQLISTHTVGLPTDTYVRMLQSFGMWQGKRPMSRIVLDSFWRCRQYLNSVTLYNIIYEFGRLRDAAGLNDFLDRLSTTNAHPKPAAKWARVDVQGLYINIPHSRQPWLLTAVIISLLQTRQYQVAEAAGVVWFSRYHADPQQDPRCKYYITSRFLQAYATTTNWESGKKWLQTAIGWLQEFTALGPDVLGRVVLRMLDFCVACGQREAYDTILRAAISTNIPLPRIRSDIPYHIKPTIKTIRQDWTDRAKRQSGRDYNDPLSYSRFSSDGVIEFARRLSQHFGEPSAALPMYVGFHPNEAAAGYKDFAGVTTTGGLTRQEQMRRYGKIAEQQTVKIQSTESQHELSMDNIIAEARVSDTVDALVHSTDSHAPLAGSGKPSDMTNEPHAHAPYVPFPQPSAFADRAFTYDEEADDMTSAAGEAAVKATYESSSKPLEPTDSSAEKLVIYGNPGVAELYELRAALREAKKTIGSLEAELQSKKLLESDMAQQVQELPKDGAPPEQSAESTPQGRKKLESIQSVEAITLKESYQSKLQRQSEEVLGETSQTPSLIRKLPWSDRKREPSVPRAKLTNV